MNGGCLDLESDEEEIEVELQVDEITIDGKEYFIDTNNILYDVDTEDEVGTYNRETGVISN